MAIKTDTSVHFTSEHALLAAAQRLDRTANQPTPDIASSQLGGATGQFKVEDEEMPLTAPDCTNDDSSMLLDEDQKPPDIAMAADHTEDAVKDDPHHVEPGADQLPDSFVPPYSW